MIQFRNNSIKLQIWDSAGQERYKALIPSYVRGAGIIFLIYDVSERKSFSNLEEWINFIKQINTDESLLVLCGNKIDLERKVTYQEGFELAKKNNMMFFETSAKDGTNVEEIFLNSANEISKKISENYYDLENDTCGIKRGLNRNAQQLHLGDQGNNNRNSGGCCN